MKKLTIVSMITFCFIFTSMAEDKLSLTIGGYDFTGALWGRFYLSVLNNKGESLSSLKSTDLELKLNAIPYKGELKLTPVKRLKQGTDYIFMLDNNSQNRGEPLERQIEGFSYLVESAEPGDSFSIFTTTNIQGALVESGSKEGALEILKRIEPADNPNFNYIYGVLKIVAERYGRQIDGRRKVAVLATDLRRLGDPVRHEELVELYNWGAIQLYPIQFVLTSARSSQFGVKRLGLMSGGRYVYAGRSIEALSRRFKYLRTLIDSCYLLEFQLPYDRFIGELELSIKTKAGTATLREPFKELFDEERRESELRIQSLMRMRNP